MKMRWIVPILALATGLAAGCGPRSVNRSPTPDQAPDRFARAVQQAHEVRRANQDAETVFYRRLGRNTVDVPGGDAPAPSPSPDDPGLAHARTGAGNP